MPAVGQGKKISQIGDITLQHNFRIICTCDIASHFDDDGEYQVRVNIF
jgi:hypothetical protein